MRISCLHLQRQNSSKSKRKTLHVTRFCFKVIPVIYSPILPVQNSQMALSIFVTVPCIFFPIFWVLKNSDIQTQFRVYEKCEPLKIWNLIVVTFSSKWSMSRTWTQILVISFFLQSSYYMYVITVIVHTYSRSVIISVMRIHFLNISPVSTMIHKCIRRLSIIIWNVENKHLKS